MNKIILNIPHSSINGIFDRKIGKWPQGPYFINNCVNKWTDWYVDMLFSSDRDNVVPIVFPFSRFVCDVERLKNDPLEKEGKGIIYTEFDGIKRGKLDSTTKQLLLKKREVHLANLGHQIFNPNYNNCRILLDCHSFPSDINENVDINLGFNDDKTYDEGIINAVKDEFEKAGFTVGINKPYANSITIPDYPNSEKFYQYKSLMIDVNKRVYMNDKILMLDQNSRQWMRWYGCLNRIYDRLSQITIEPWQQGK